jgi:hypothetical protein
VPHQRPKGPGRQFLEGSSGGLLDCGENRCGLDRRRRERGFQRDRLARWSARWSARAGRRFGFGLWDLEPIEAAQLDRHVFIDGAGMRLLFRDAQFREPL